MTAAENGHTAVVAALLEAGAPWNQQDKSGYCAGEYATASKKHEIVEMIMEWGVQAELLLGAASRTNEEASTSGTAGSSAANAGYLQQKLVYTPDGDKLLDADGEAVMMGWEAPLMEKHAAAICRGGGGHYLNVGFGLGIVDNEIQRYSPASHTIIEAHPDVYAHMCKLGWDSRPGVRVLFGRWQEVLPQLESYDGIFFDTYGEYYEEMREFHQQLPRLLRPGGVYSYFNGLASDNFFFHSVYGRLVQVELATQQLQVRFEQLRVAELGDEVWQGVRNKYWHFPLYFLPVVTHAAAAGGDAQESEQQQQQQQGQQQDGKQQ
uniref:RMT2 domain-containing protein n=1 Tax=Tetradesmus obliquus TaxID=3088 RepID=A0A383WQ27_TETOB|eukprot:jgi/Sobl393_1/8909/SZX79319.1